MPKNRSLIASEIGVSVATLWRRIKKHKLYVPPGPVFPVDEWRIKMLFNLVPPEEILQAIKFVKANKLSNLEEE